MNWIRRIRTARATTMLLLIGIGAAACKRSSHSTAEGPCSPWRERATQIGLQITNVDPLCNTDRLRGQTTTSLDDLRPRLAAQGFDVRHHVETTLDIARTSVIAFPPHNGSPFTISIHEPDGAGRREIQMSSYTSTIADTIGDDSLARFDDAHVRARQAAIFRRQELARRLLDSAERVPERCPPLAGRAATDAASSLLRVPPRPRQPDVTSSTGGRLLRDLLADERADANADNGAQTFTAYYLPEPEGAAGTSGNVRYQFIGEVLVGVVDVTAGQLACRVRVSPAGDRPRGASSVVTDADIVRSAEIARARLLGSR